MSNKKPTNIAASALARLKNLAEQRGWNYAHMVTRYGIERFLYRLATSPYAGQFVLKGGNLFVIWQNGNNSRPTLDSDFLCFGDATEEHLKSVFTALCEMPVAEDDGVRFDPTTIGIEPIRAATEYGGTRVTLTAFIGTVRLALQFDIGVGDAVTPAPVDTEFPVLLPPMKTPRLKAYPMATAIAEKASAMVTLALNNSRMKDFFDIWLLSEIAEHDYPTLALAIRNTFSRSRIPLPVSLPVAFTKQFAENPSKRLQWAAFLRRHPTLTAPANFAEIVERVAQFLVPAFCPPTPAPTRWLPARGWE